MAQKSEAVSGFMFSSVASCYPCRSGPTIAAVPGLLIFIWGCVEHGSIAPGYSSPEAKNPTQAARRTSLSAASRQKPLSVRNRHSTDRGRRSNIELIVRVEDGNGRSQARARADRTAGHDLAIWSDGTAWSSACPRHHRGPAETIFNKVLDAGINYIDTSIDYGLRARPEIIESTSDRVNIEFTTTGFPYHIWWS